MVFNKYYILLIFLYLVSIGCNSSNQQSIQITGSVNYVGDASINIAIPPLHYKYSPKNVYPIQVDNNGDFTITINDVDSPFLHLNIDEKQLLILSSPDDQPIININRAQFPLNTTIKSNKYQQDYDAYLQYLQEIDGMDKAIEKEMNAYKAGEENSAIKLSNQKVDIATSLLTNTKFEPLIAKARGELLVNKIKSVEYRFYNPGFDADTERSKILEEAQNDGVFTLKSLEAQRAGIRDISHYYARTFGIYDSVRNVHGDDLAEIDIKRLGYKSLNEKRIQLLDYITSENAKAYASMTLVAERIGEIDLEIAEKSYFQYLDEYSNYTNYTDFLHYFYSDIKTVSPGQDGIPFTLPDSDGNLVQFSDFRGKYVLLDFWAGWCQPCLDEFPNMREIYNDFSRDDFEIIGISTEVDEQVWRDDIERFKNPWIQLYGGNGFDQETFKTYKGGGIPFYILLDREGKIVRYDDIRATNNLREVLTELISKS